MIWKQKAEALQVLVMGGEKLNESQCTSYILIFPILN